VKKFGFGFVLRCRKVSPMPAMHERILEKLGGGMGVVCKTEGSDLGALSC
jgi:hypothetical protein